MRQLGAGELLTSRVGADEVAIGERAQALHALGDHGGVARVGEEAVVDRQRRPRVGRAEAHRPRERGFIANTATLTS